MAFAFGVWIEKKRVGEVAVRGSAGTRPDAGLERHSSSSTIATTSFYCFLGTPSQNGIRTTIFIIIIHNDNIPSSRQLRRVVVFQRRGCVGCTVGTILARCRGCAVTITADDDEAFGIVFQQHPKIGTTTRNSLSACWIFLLRTDRRLLVSSPPTRIIPMATAAAATTAITSTTRAHGDCQF